MSFRSKAGFAAAVAVLAVPASASAATKTVDMGLPTAQQKPFQNAVLGRQRLLPARDDDPRRRHGQVRADRVPQRRHPAQGRAGAAR